MNAKAVPPLCRLVAALALSLAACAATASAAPVPSARPIPRLAAPSAHAPVILRVAQRDVTENGAHSLYVDIYFRDAAGDATTLINRLTSVDPAGGLFLNLTDDPVSAPAEQQKQEGLVSVRYGCPTSLLDPFSFTVEDRVQDRGGNLSGPVIFNVSCPATIKTDLSLFSMLALAMGVVLLLAAGLYIGLRPSQGKPLLLSLLLLLCSIMVLAFAQMILHEGGHALMVRPTDPAQGPVLYVHPFTFAGYSRPMFERTSILAHAAGALFALLVALLITLPFWKRRSLPFLALAMFFPWSALNNGGYIASAGGDFHNIISLTGLSPVVFNIVGVLIALVGAGMLFALLPLVGLPPNDLKSLVVLPAALYLWSVLSRVVAVLLVPGSPFAARWHLAGEILMSSNEYSLVIIGLVLAVLYVTLYRWLSPKLPSWLRTGPVAPAWKDLRVPGLLAVLSLIIGLMVVIF